MSTRRFTDYWRFLVPLLGVVLALSWSTASACGCGVYIPRNGDARVSQERALIRWDGKVEDIVMALGVLGQSKEAAVILPVPSRASVKLGDAKVFDALEELTKPKVEKQYALFPPSILGARAVPPTGAEPVSLLQRQTLGPFDVSTLSATDANALGDWLKTNGYNFPPQLTRVLTPYVSQKWDYVAVRLTPGNNSGDLTGMLDPLWISFASDKLVYPMRPSALAKERLDVLIYVLANHKVQTSTFFGFHRVTFADWVDPASLEKGSPLAQLVPRKYFLTTIDDQIYDPSQIDDDYVFQFAANDETYHEVTYEFVYDIGGVPIIFLAYFLVCMLPVAVLFAVILFLAMRRSRSARTAYAAVVAMGR